MKDPLGVELQEAVISYCEAEINVTHSATNAALALGALASVSEGCPHTLRPVILSIIARDTFGNGSAL